MRFVCYAWPQAIGVTGNRAFVVSQQGEVFSTPNKDSQDYSNDSRDTVRLGTANTFPLHRSAPRAWDCVLSSGTCLVPFVDNVNSPSLKSRSAVIHIRAWSS